MYKRQVEGREMYSLSFESQEMQVGGVITNVKYPPRELTIKYKLEDRDLSLIHILRSKDLPVFLTSFGSTNLN